LEFCNDSGAQKTSDVPSWQSQKFDTIPQREGQTDGRTDRQKW